MPHVFQTLDKHGTPHALWRFQYRDYLGRKRMRTGATTRRETEKIAIQVQAHQHAIRNGVLPAPRPSDTVRNIDDVVTEYLLWGSTQGGRRGRPWGREHARKREQDIAFWKQELKLRTQMDLIDIQSRVERVIHRIHVANGRTGKTAWNRVEALAAFVRWCVDRDYLADDPLRRLKKINTEPVRRRRPLSTEEIEKLLAGCLPERRLLYETALCTGLRANELRSLTPIHLDGARCVLRLEAEWTKNRLAAFQPVPKWLIDKLLEQAASLQPEEPIFRLQKSHCARMIQDDLKRVGIPITLPGEGKVDFHCLRMTYCTLLDVSGASAKETQELARHSTPVLTMARYVRVRVDRVRGVVEAVGEIVHPTAPPEPSAKEGLPDLRVLQVAG